MSENAVLSGLLNHLETDTAVAAMRTSITRTERTSDLSLTLPDGAREAVTALLAKALDDSEFSTPVVLLVTATAREAEDLARGLDSWMDAEVVGHFPSWETLPHERLSPRSDTV
ncbi:MAG: hypothetical protein L0K44_08325, partial [Yaniella sp.]|nr:hypothetical protein [Yaniella sp.]